MTYSVSADLLVKPGMEEKFETIIGDLAAIVRCGPDVETYRLYRMAKEPGKYRMLEAYSDRAAFDRHMKSDHMAAILPVMLTCLVNAPVIDKLEIVA